MRSTLATLTKQTMDRRRRRTSTKQRLMILVVRSDDRYEPPHLPGRYPAQKRLQDQQINLFRPSQETSQGARHKAARARPRYERTRCPENRYKTPQEKGEAAAIRVRPVLELWVSSVVSKENRGDSGAYNCTTGHEVKLEHLHPLCTSTFARCESFFAKLFRSRMVGRVATGTLRIITWSTRPMLTGLSGMDKCSVFS